MSAYYTIKVIPDAGDEFDLSIQTRDILFWEKTGKDRSFGDLISSNRLSDLYSLAHAAAKRQGKFDGPLKDFEEQVEVQMVSEEDQGPTPAGR